MGASLRGLNSSFNLFALPIPQAGGGKIVFASDREGLAQTYLMNADGSGQTRLSDGGGNDDNPRWSPQGSTILFQSDRNDPVNGYNDIYVMNADGSGQTRLTWGDGPFRDEQPIWSPDGTKLAFSSTRDSVVETWQETDEDGGVVQRTAVRTNKEVYVMNADGSNQVRLTDSLGNDDSSSWSPDGSRIIFRRDRERDCCDPNSQIWVMAADGTGQVNLSGNQYGDYSASWSAGGGSKTLPAAAAASAPPSPANQVTINFNNLAGHTVVHDQYLPYVTFSGNGFSAPSNYPYGSDVVAQVCLTLTRARTTRACRA